ncbi:titin-like [Carassius auratus]|uniref:Titin-like n=1 Tax=Carassius auratus TaxID=7957 RepID=A0A6P6IZM1_CARAU|nr:titin-like [Carassius auratus]
MKHVSNLLSLLMDFLVYGASGVEVSVFVMKGDSVTLHNDFERNPNWVKWDFHDIIIAEIHRYRGYICTNDPCKERFRNRLKLDHQTGSLTIMNTRITDSGDYQLWTAGSRKGNSKRIFTVVVRGFSGVDTDDLSVSVEEGDSVTLQNDVEMNKQDRIRWYFNEAIIAEITGDLSYICTDIQCKERFRDRLQLDHQTGSLTITNITITDSGLYDLLIKTNSRISASIFFVYVNGVSSAERDKLKRKSVKEGESITLDRGVGKKPNDLVMWYFNDSRIAEFSGVQSKNCTDDLYKERFRDRLKLDHQTGSLTITNTRTTDSGLYKLQINSSNRITILKSYTVAITSFLRINTDGLSMFLMEGSSVTLCTNDKANHKDDIRWYFYDILIAHITEDHSKTCTDVQCEEGDERFRGRLKLDNQTGSLTITNTKTTDSGLYKLQISSSSGDSFTNKTFIVVVHGFFSIDTGGVHVFLMEGDSVTLHTDVKTTQQENIRWYFNDTHIAQITGDLSYICTDVRCNGGNERLRDRLKLDHQTGSLTITDTRTTDSGDYQLMFNNSISGVLQLFSVVVHDVSAAERDKMKRKSVMEGESVILDSGVIKNPNDLMTWYFTDICIAEIKRDIRYISTDVQCGDGDLRFRDRLKLDHQTGSLTIINTRELDSGVYQLQINNSRFSISKGFSVTITDYIGIGTGVLVTVTEGDSVTLQTGVKTKEQKIIKWYFKAICIAQITGDLSFICTDVQCNEGNERFRGRLKLGNQTGSLTITNTRTTDSGDYQLKINNSRFSENTFMISVHEPTTREVFGSIEQKSITAFVTEGDSVTLFTDVKTNQQEDIRWYFNGILIAEINGDLSYICTDVQCYGGDERFRDRLQLDLQTGSLTITDIRITDSGEYTLISNRIIRMTFIITVQGHFGAKQDEIIVVKEGESITLDSDVEKSPDDIVTFYFNDNLITEITEDHNKTCTDVQCEDADERFRDRLKVNQSSGSLTITNTKTTDLGLYKLKITSNSNNISIISFKRFSINVTAVSDSGLSSDTVAGICAAAVVVVLLFIAVVAAVVYYHRPQAGQNDTKTKHGDQANGVKDLTPKNQSDSDRLWLKTISDSSPNETEIEGANETPM